MKKKNSRKFGEELMPGALQAGGHRRAAAEAPDLGNPTEGARAAPTAEGRVGAGSTRRKAEAELGRRVGLARRRPLRTVRLRAPPPPTSRHVIFTFHSYFHFS